MAEGFFKRQPKALAATALFALAVVTVRAATQSVTIDEADTFLSWVAPQAPSHWVAASNNHLLNSILIRICVSLFGASQFTVRIPALAGAALYIAAACALARVIASSAWREWVLLACLVYNPFVLDYLVAARGYGLAAAFLLGAIAVAAWDGPGKPERTCALVSVSLALSFAANFAFAFVDGAAMLVLFAWIHRRAEPEKRRLGRLLACCLGPALVASLFLTAPTVASWPKGQLWFGAHSLRETFAGIVESSFYRVNPQIANPLLYRVLEWCAPAVLPVLVICCLCRLLPSARGEAALDARRQRRAALAGALSGILVLTLGLHWISFRMFHLLLPKERTGLFFVPLFTLLAGLALEIPMPGTLGKVSRAGLAAALAFSAVYFVFSLRLNHFKEWKWDAEVDRVYPVLAYYNRAYGVTDVGCNWMYVAALNFYRSISGRESLREFKSGAPAPPPPDRAVYVLNYVFDEEFIKRQRLEIVYRGPLSDVVVAVRPDVLSCKHPWKGRIDSRSGSSITGREQRCPRRPCCWPSARFWSTGSVSRRFSSFSNCPST